ncbi:hypothetical protein MJI28_22110, partial [Salmonella enterica subsp. enterica serovar Montevideo]|nr:hypothetical protein [Salmonella enterica subsp. enterica serovar Montevideo]
PARSQYRLIASAASRSAGRIRPLRKKDPTYGVPAVALPNRAPEAIACAKQSAAELGLTRLHFQALDSTQFATAQGETPDLVLVNPPRRGIGKPLCDYLAQMAPRFIIYSSCNAQTMAQDIRHLPNYRIQRVQLFDMFPHTAHYEVLTLLCRL